MYLNLEVNNNYSNQNKIYNKNRFYNKENDIQITFSEKSYFDEVILNSNYKSENLIRKEVYVNDIILDEVKKMIINSKIFEQEDKKWPRPNNILGSQELEIIYKKQHIFFSTCKIGTFADIKNSKDPVGLEILYYLVSDLKCFLLTLMNMHFKIKPVFKN